MVGEAHTRRRYLCFSFMLFMLFHLMSSLYSHRHVQTGDIHANIPSSAGAGSGRMLENAVITWGADRALGIELHVNDNQLDLLKHSIGEWQTLATLDPRKTGSLHAKTGLPKHHVDELVKRIRKLSEDVLYLQQDLEEIDLQDVWTHLHPARPLSQTGPKFQDAMIYSFWVGMNASTQDSIVRLAVR